MVGEGIVSKNSLAVYMDWGWAVLGSLRIADSCCLVGGDWFPSSRGPGCASIRSPARRAERFEDPLFGVIMILQPMNIIISLSDTIICCVALRCLCAAL